MTAIRAIERPERDQLGETPFWDEESQTLFWCDIVGRRVQRLDPATGDIRRWSMPAICSAIVPSDDGHAVVALKDGVYRMDLDTGEVAPFCRPDEEPRNRSNEVRTDRRGRLWLGTMGDNIGPNGEDMEVPETHGSIFCIDGQGRARRLLGGIKITNTFCWSPDESRFYTADTHKRVIWSFAYDPDEPAVSDRKVLIEGDIAPGNPDGASVDEEGFLWSARWGGGRIVRLSPDGRVDRTLELPALQPSSCCFGGADRRTLYITTARQGMDAPTDADGQLYAVDLDVAGLPMKRFRIG